MIGRKVSLSLVNMVAGLLLGLAAQKLMAIYWGDAYSGQWSYAVGILGLAYFVTDLGMGQAHIKRVSEGRDPGDCFATYAVFKVAATLFFLLMVVGGLWVYVGMLGKPLQDTTLSVVVFVLVYYVAKSLQDIAQASFDARIEVARSQLGLFSDTFVRVGATALFALFVAAIVRNSGPLVGRLDPDNPYVAWVRDDPAALLALASALGGLAGAAVSLSMLWHALERGRFQWDLLKDYATFAFPLFLTSSVGIISSNIDTAALGFFLSDADVGLFARVRAIAFTPSGVIAVASMILFPTLSALAARGEHEAVQRHLDQSVRYLSMAMMPIVAFTSFFAEEVIRLTLAEEFVRGAPIMTLLVAYVYVTGIAAPHAALVMGMGKVGVIARIGIVTSILVIVLDLLLIPQDIRSLGIPLAGFGAVGAAAGTLASGVVYYAAVRYVTRRIAGYRERAHAWKHLLASAAMIAALLAIEAYVTPLERWFHFLAYAAVGAAAYAAVLVLLRELRKEDYEMLRASVDPGEMARYVRTELGHRRR